MNQHQQLERLLTLHERRRRRAEAALAEQRRSCRAEAERIAMLDAELSHQRERFDRQEHEWFDTMQGAPISAQTLEQTRQTMEDHYHHQAQLLQERQAADNEHRRQLAECDQRASECAQRMRQFDAIEALLERKRSHKRRIDEGRAELELEDIALSNPQGQPSPRGQR